MMRIASTLLAALLLAATLISVVASRPRTPAVACTGGGDPLEWATEHADRIVIGDAVNDDGQFQVVESFIGDPGTALDVGAGSRVADPALSATQSSPMVTNCAGSFAPRYIAGRRYLLFVDYIDTGFPLVRIVLPVDGIEVITGDPLLTSSNNGTLYMGVGLYQAFFEGFAQKTYGDEIVYLDAGRVPLSIVIAAISSLRPTMTIVPPETGTAGLAAGRTQ